MKFKQSILALSMFSLVYSSISQVPAEAQQRVNATAKTNLAMTYQVSRPVTSGNISLFLIKGADRLKGQTYLTLPEGLAKKQVIVKETGDVNVLKVDNLSNSVVFIQSGEIVKGGRQDRALQSDMLIQPHAKGVSLPCFCVEHDRWSGRGGEHAGQFNSAKHFVVGNKMNLAIKSDRDQSKVWDAVATKQKELSQSLGGTVAAPASPSSMQLTLEQEKVKGAVKSQYNALSKVIDNEKGVIGYAVAINGKISHADVYASGDLFKKLWPGLLNSAVTEAVSQKGQPSLKAPTVIDVKEVLLAAATAKPARPSSAAGGVSGAPSLQGATNGSIGIQGNDATYLSGVNTGAQVRSKPASTYFFRTMDKKGDMVHENYIGK